MTGRSAAVRRIAAMIDHSLLRPELVTADVVDGCRLAAVHRVGSVCVRPRDVPRAVAELAGTGVAVGTVVGFPHGSSGTATKVAEAAAALAAGATELDMVLPVGALLGDEDDAVRADIAAVVATGAPLVKVILENAHLDDGHKVRGCHLAEDAGAHFVKTSTGFAPGGATAHDVALMRASVSDRVGVKAAGGVRTLDVLLDLADAGATRFGATRTESILAAAADRLG